MPALEVIAQGSEMTVLLGALTALKKGKPGMRLPLDWTGVAGKVADEKAFREAASVVPDAIDPISDFRGSAEYKRKMAVVHVRRALAEASARAGRPV